jgi:hypothetical protein
MSPRKRTTPKPAPLTTEVDIAAINGLRHLQRNAVYGVQKNTPAVDDTMPPARLHGEDGHELTHIVQLFREAGRQWALTGHLTFGELTPTYAELVENDHGPPSFKASFVGIGATNGGYSTALAERYLRESGLEHAPTREHTPLELLLSRQNWRTHVHAIRTPRTDTAADRLELYQTVRARVESLTRYAGEYDTWNAACYECEKEHRPAPAEPDTPAWLSPAESAELRAFVRRTFAEPSKLGGQVVLMGPELERRVREGVPLIAALFSSFEALRDECERPATLDDVDTWTLTRADGTRAPSPEAWLATLAAQGEQHRGDAEWWLMNGLEVLAKDARKAREAELTARAERAERELERERKRRKDAEAGLPDRTVFPGHMIRYGHAGADDFARLADMLENGQGELFPHGNALEVIRSQAELQPNTSQLGDMTAAEVRALHGVFRLFTRGGDDRRTFNADMLPVDASVFYKAAAVTSRRSKDRAAVFDGLRSLSRRALLVALKVKDPKDGKMYVIGERTPLFEVRPMWTASDDGRRALTEQEADAIARHYLQHMDADEPWTGPLPDRFVFTLPPLMQRISDRLVLRGDVLDRLEAGSRAVRGAQGGLNPLDHRLLIEITQREQTQHRSKDGLRVRSFVDRERLLEDHYGAEKLAKWRRSGKFRERATEPFENAARALVAGGLVAHWEPNYRTTAGESRDVFELVPGVVVGSEGLQADDPAQTALPLRGKKPRRPRAKKAAS